MELKGLKDEKISAPELSLKHNVVFMLSDQAVPSDPGVQMNPC